MTTAIQRTGMDVQQIVESLNLIGIVRSREEMMKLVGLIFSRVFLMIHSASKCQQELNQLVKLQLLLQMQ